MRGFLAYATQQVFGGQVSLLAFIFAALALSQAGNALFAIVTKEFGSSFHTL